MNTPFVLFATVWIFLGSACVRQPVKEAYHTKYGAPTISSIEEFKDRVHANPDLALVDLRTYLPDAQFDIVYATNENFMNKPVYSQAAAYLRKPAAEALKAVQDDLAHRGYGIKVWDAYRPYSVTVAFYEKVQDSTFTASPYTGSKHNRGCAVDLTLTDLTTGNELPMPTRFDEFVAAAHVEYNQLPRDVLENRALLIEVMAKYGFTVYKDEWWHFDFKGWERYDLLDLEFDELEVVSKTARLRE